MREDRGGAADGDEASAPLLLAGGVSGARSDEASTRHLQGWPRFGDMLKEAGIQNAMGGPLALNLAFIYLRQIVTLAFLGGHGKVEDLAAASLAMTICNTLGSLFLMGLCGATATLGSQAWGQGNADRLTIVFQRTVAFLAVHAVPVTLLVVGAPYVLLWMGQEPATCYKMIPYMLVSLPSIWLDVVDRPMNQILIAQQITQPQMYLSAIVLILHLVTNFVFFNIYNLTYWYAGVAASLARFYYFLLQVGYILLYNKTSTVWGRPSWKAFENWDEFAGLAYPAAIMRCMESFCYSGMTVAAGLLPNAAIAIAAINVAFNIYGVLFMVFLGSSVSVGVRVGNALGAGRPGDARLSALTAVACVPTIWLPLAVVLCTPLTQAWIIGIFVPPAETGLWRTLQNLLYIVAGLELLDGLQTVMTGVVTGTGKQRSGAVINGISFYAIAVPAALILAFSFQYGVYGLYTGLGLGPLVQCFLYSMLISGIDWVRESHRAVMLARA